MFLLLCPFTNLPDFSVLSCVHLSPQRHLTASRRKTIWKISKECFWLACFHTRWCLGWCRPAAEVDIFMWHCEQCVSLCIADLGKVVQVLLRSHIPVFLLPHMYTHQPMYHSMYVLHCILSYTPPPPLLTAPLVLILFPRLPSTWPSSLSTSKFGIMPHRTALFVRALK